MNPEARSMVSGSDGPEPDPSDRTDDGQLLRTDREPVTFVDFWDCDIVDDYQQDFATAIESARRLDPQEGRVGTLANKSEVVLITHHRMAPDLAVALAYELVANGDSRIVDPTGPAGAIPLWANFRHSGDGPAWLFFGWSPNRAWSAEV